MFYSIIWTQQTNKILQACTMTWLWRYELGAKVRTLLQICGVGDDYPPLGFDLGDNFCMNLQAFLSTRVVGGPESSPRGNHHSIVNVDGRGWGHIHFCSSKWLNFYSLINLNYMYLTRVCEQENNAWQLDSLQWCRKVSDRRIWLTKFHSEWQKFNISAAYLIVRTDKIFKISPNDWHVQKHFNISEFGVAGNENLIPMQCHATQKTTSESTDFQNNIILDWTWFKSCLPFPRTMLIICTNCSCLPMESSWFLVLWCLWILHISAGSFFWIDFERLWKSNNGF